MSCNFIEEIYGHTFCIQISKFFNFVRYLCENADAAAAELHPQKQITKVNICKKLSSHSRVVSM